jgi:uncharacterized protein
VASILILLFAAFFGGLIRRLSGFGGALIMSPILMWIFPTPFFVPIVLSCEFLGGIFLSSKWSISQEDNPRYWRILLFSTILFPIGILVGEYVDSLTIKILTSVVVAIFAIYLLINTDLKIKASKIYDFFAGGVSGILLGSCGIGGPPVALYLNAIIHDFHRTRALLSKLVTGMALLGIVVATFMGSGTEWIQYLFFAMPAYYLGILAASFILNRHIQSDAYLKRLCLWLMITNSVCNLTIITLYQ